MIRVKLPVRTGMSVGLAVELDEVKLFEAVANTVVVFGSAVGAVTVVVVVVVVISSVVGSYVAANKQKMPVTKR